MEKLTNCCESCKSYSDCLCFLPPWKSKHTGNSNDIQNGGQNECNGSDNLMVVDYHFRGRVDSCTSLEDVAAMTLASTEVIAQQPMSSSTTETSGHTQHRSSSLHKRSVASLDSALLASATGILSQALPGGRGTEVVLMQISLTYEPAAITHESLLVIFLLSLRNYHSTFLPHLTNSGLSNPSPGGHEGSPLLQHNSGPALMVRLSLEHPSSGVHFSSVQTRCTKNPVWKETISLDGVQSLKKALTSDSTASTTKSGGDPASQRLLVVLYETNKFNKWTPVRSGNHCIRDIQIQGTHNLSIEMTQLHEDIYPYGEIKLCLCYNKSTNRVYCDILEVRSLLHWALTKKGEYFIKVQFFDKKKITKIKKTAAVKPDSSSTIAVFETIRSKVAMSSLDNLSIRFLVCDSKVIMADSTLYYVTFGQDNSSGPAETTYWADFIRDIPASGKKQWFSLYQKQ